MAYTNQKNYVPEKDFQITALKSQVDNLNTSLKSLSDKVANMGPPEGYYLTKPRPSLDTFNIREKDVLELDPTNTANVTITTTKVARQFKLIKNDSVLNCNSLGIAATITTSNSTNNPALLPFALESCIDDMIIKFGSLKIDDITHFSQRAVQFNMYKYGKAWADSTGTSLALTNFTESDNQSTNGTSYRVIMVFPEFTFLGGIPWLDMAKNDLTIDINFKLNANSMSTADGGTTTITISDLNLIGDYFTGETYKKISSMLPDSYICTGLEGLDDAIASGGTSFTNNFNVSKKFLKSIVTRQYLTASLTDQDLYTKLTHTAFNSTTAFNYKVGGHKVYQDNQTLTSAVQSIYYTIAAYNFANYEGKSNLSNVHNSLYEKPTLINDDIGSAISRGFNMSCALEFDSSVISPYDSEKSGANVIFTWAGTASAATTVYHDIFYDRIINVKKLTITE